MSIHRHIHMSTYQCRLHRGPGRSNKATPMAAGEFAAHPGYPQGIPGKSSGNPRQILGKTFGWRFFESGFNRYFTWLLGFLPKKSQSGDCSTEVVLSLLSLLLFRPVPSFLLYLLFSLFFCLQPPAGLASRSVSKHVCLKKTSQKHWGKSCVNWPWRVCFENHWNPERGEGHVFFRAPSKTILVSLIILYSFFCVDDITLLCSRELLRSVLRKKKQPFNISFFLLNKAGAMRLRKHVIFFLGGKTWGGE